MTPRQAMSTDPVGDRKQGEWLRKQLRRRHGIWGVVMLAALVSTALSALVASVVTYGILDGSMGYHSWMITLLCPLLISIPVSWATFRIVQELYLVQEQLSELSDRDPLTLLHNRRHFMRSLGDEIERARRYGSSLSVAILDIDDFKGINDRWGHPVGDEVICQVARVCSAELRHTDALARIGGEEFAILLRETPLDAAEALFERVRSAVSDLLVPADEGELVRVTISIGAVSPQSGGVPEMHEILRHADRALYSAKETGKDRVVSFNAPPPRRAA